MQQKKTSSKKLLIFLIVILLNPISLAFYFFTAIDYYTFKSAQPELEAKFQALQLPEECILLKKKGTGGGINSSPSLSATYKCSTAAQDVYNKLFNVYQFDSQVIKSGPGSYSMKDLDGKFATNFYTSGSKYSFNLHTGAAIYEDGEIDGSIDPSTNSVYLSVFIDAQ